METQEFVHVPVLLSDACYQELTRARKLQTVHETGLRDKEQKENGGMALTDTSAEERFTAHHWHAEQGLQPSVVLATLPQLDLGVVRTCAPKMKQVVLVQGSVE